MNISAWLKDWLSARRATRPHLPRLDHAARLSLRKFEDRQVLSVSASFLGGVLDVAIDGGTDSNPQHVDNTSNVLITVDALNHVLINGVLVDSNNGLLGVQSLDAMNVSSITVHDVAGAANTIDLSGVSVASGFTNAGGVSVSLNGGAGVDTITGSAFNDLMTGGAGNDSLRGGGGNDVYQFLNAFGVDTVIDTGGTADSLNLSAITTDISVNLQTHLATVGANSVNFAVAEIDSIVGHSGGDDTLQGLNAASHWNIGATGTDYSSTGAAINALGFETFQGGSLADTFHVGAAGSWTLKGGAGADVFDIDAAFSGTLDGQTDSDTIQGTGGSIAGPVTIATGDRLSPGDSPGILSTGNLTFATGSTFVVEIDDDSNAAYPGGVAGVDYDQMQVTGTVSIGTTAVLNLANLTSTELNTYDIYTIIDNNGTADAVTGVFGSLTGGVDLNGGTLANGDDFTFAGDTWRIYYNGGDGNDVILINRPAIGINVFVSNATSLTGHDFTGLTNGTFILDVDFLTAGNQNGVYGVNAFATLTEAVVGVDAGQTVHVNSGTYLQTGTLVVQNAMTIDGQGMQGASTTHIRRSGAPGGEFDEAIRVEADDVTISDVRLGWVNTAASPNLWGYVLVLENRTNLTGGTGGTLDPGGMVEGTMVSNVFFGEGYSSAIVMEGTNLTEISDSIFDGNWGRAAIRDGTGLSIPVDAPAFGSIGTPNTNFLITRNEFREDHFRWGPISFGPQDLTAYHNSFSGVVSFNYFANGLGTNFQALGDMNYTITVTNNAITGITGIPGLAEFTGRGLVIDHNTFDWNDSNQTNLNGVYAQPVGVYIAPTVTTNTNLITIQDNIFNNFAFTGPQPGTVDPLWISGGKFGGALEFDGVDDFATFMDPSFEVGSQGTLSFWANLQNVSKRNQLFEGPGDGGMEFQYREHNLTALRPTQGQFYGRTDAGLPADFAIQNGVAKTAIQNTWTHLLYTWDFATKELHIFQNGTQVTYLAGSDFNIANWTDVVETASRQMYVGRDPGDGTRYLDGALDDVAWFDRALNVTGADAGTVSTIISSGVAAIGAHADLVAHWDLDTTTGFTEADNVNGIVMNVFTATPTNDGPQFRPGMGQFGGALEFDGIDDFATFQDPTFNVGAAGAVNMWVKLNDLTSRNTFFEGSTNGMEFAYRENSPSGQFFGSPTRVPSANNLAIQNGNAGSLTDQWVNLQYTWNFNGGVGQEMHIFINGTEVTYVVGTAFDSTLTLWTSVLNTTTELMTMGKDGNSSGREFGGLIDDVAWFNSELSTTQLNDIRTLGVTQAQINLGGGLSGSYVDATASGNGGNLIAYWNMNDAVGTTTVTGDGGTTITLNLDFDPPPPPPDPVSGYGVFTNATTNANVLNNVFFNDETGGAFGVSYADSNQTLDPSNITGPTANPFFNGDQSGYSGTTLAEFYRLRFGSSAAYQSTEFEANIATAIPHIGANQENPVAVGTEDILVVGSDFDDLVVVTFTSDNDGFFSYTRDVTGGTPDYVGTFNFTNITSFTFEAYGGDDVFIVYQPTAAQGSLYSLVNGITFHGGFESNNGNALNSDGATGGDTLVLLKSATNVAVLDSATYVFGNESAAGYTGTITLINAALSTVITFTGTEPIRDELSVNERTFTFASMVGGGHETITVSTLGDTVAMTPTLPYQPVVISRTLDNRITSTLGPSVSFTNPRTLLDINAGSGDDTVNITSLHAAYRAEMDISGDAGFDTVNLNSNLTLGDATVGNTGDLTVTAGTIHVTKNIDTIGTGVVSLTADDGSITMDNGTATTTDTGSITYSATGNVALSRLISTSGALYVTAGSGTSVAGAITDNTVDETANLVTTGTVMLAAETGIGSAGDNPDIDTTVPVLDVSNSTSGNIDLTEADAVTVIQLSQSGGGDATLRTVNGSITVDNAGAVLNAITFSGEGTLLLDANGETADVLVNDGIHAVQGHITILADRDIVATSAPIASSGGDGNIALQAGHDIRILDTGDVNPVDVSVAGAGRVTLFAVNTVVLGSQDPDAVSDVVQHTLANDVVVQTGTGAVTNTLPLVYDIQAPQINSQGQVFLTMTLGRPGEHHITVTVFWGDGNLTTTSFANPGTYTFMHQYFGNPDPLDQSAPILINVQVAHDPQVVITALNVNTNVGSVPDLGVPAPPPVPAQNINTDLSRAIYGSDARAAAAGPFSGVDTKLFSAPGSFANPGLVMFQDTTLRATVVPVPGDGLASFPFDVAPPVDLLTLPEAAKILDILQQAGVQLSEGSTVRIAAVQADDSQLSERVLMLEILSPDGEVQQNIVLPETVLDDMLEVIGKLPDGKYRFQMREPGEDRLRLLLEFEVRQGKIVGEDEATDRPPSSKKKPGVMGDPPAVPEATPDATDPEESIMQVLPAHGRSLDSIVRESQEPWGGWSSGMARRAWRRAESVGISRVDRDDSSGEVSLPTQDAPAQLSRAAQLFRKFSKRVEG